MTIYESGVRNRRTEFVPESTAGETPSDPSWEALSDRIIGVDFSPDPQSTVDQAVGSVDPADHEKGTESHEVTLEYRLQRWLVDGSGNPQDVAGYGIVRGSDGEAYSSVTIVDREDRSSGGNDSAGLRLYKVAKGCKVSGVTFNLDPESGEPIPVEVTLAAERIRYFQIHQPSAATAVTVVSDDNGDMQDVTIEDEGAGTSETVTLNGTTAQTTTATFADIDAIEVSGDHAGTITVSDGSGTTLAEIDGSNDYSGGYEGDLGVPALGTGSHASAVGTAFEYFGDDSITRGGSAIATEIVGGELTISNEVEEVPRTGTYAPVIQLGKREVTISTTLLSEARSFDEVREALKATAADIVWTAAGGTVTLKDAVLTSPGAPGITPDDIVVQPESTFQAGSGGIVVT